MRRRARLLVVGIALLVSASMAAGDFTVTPMAPNAGSGSSATTMRAVFSVRNEAATAVTASVVSAAVAEAIGCANMTLEEFPNATMGPWLIEAGAQRQFLVRAAFPASGTFTCDWMVMAAGQAPAQFTTTFSVGGASDIFNVQPAAFEFAVPAGKPSETQRALLQNYGGSTLMYSAVSIAQVGGGNALTISRPGHPCDGLQTCTGESIGSMVYTTLDFKCTPPATGQATGTITYVSPAGMRTQTYTCRRAGLAPLIQIAEEAYTLSATPPATATAMVNVTASSTDALQSAEIIGVDATAFRLVAPAGCSAQTCTFSTPQALPKQLTVECTPGTTQKTAVLRVRGEAHADDVDEAALACVADGGITATPAQLAFGDVKVTTTSAPQTLTIENLGATTANVLVDTGHPDWLADACVAEACAIPGGGTQDIELRFAPSVPAQNDRTMTILVEGTPAASVELTGNGVGSRMRITTHAMPYRIDFGTIGLGTQRKRTVGLQAEGNRSLTVGIGTPAAPFMASKPAIDLAAGAEDTFDITCSSSSAGTFDSMVTLAPGPAENVYAADAPKLDVHCSVANTPLRVLPDDLDFGEVRRGDPPPSIEVEIHNPSAQPITLAYVRLANAGPLSLVGPADMQLEPGATVTATIALSTAAEATLQSALEVGVGSEQLVTPITGKIVTASARVTPTSLRLGSVCIGTQIEEPVKLVNDGTARLRVQPPLMEDPFAVALVSPVSYPEGGALLAPLEEARANVLIATATEGRVAGKLTWDVDVPGAPFVIDASLDIKDAGIAVSPQAVGFDQVLVDERSERRTIRLENCGDFESEIVLDGVEPVRGRGDAWELTPSVLTARLPPGEKLAIEVRFAPTRPGPHVAIVKLAVDGVAQEIELTGNGVGDLVERGSLYACSCASGGSPLHGVPLVLVLFVVVTCRRRSGSSSAR